MDIKKQRGRFELPFNKFNINTEDHLMIMSKCIIIRAEYMAITGTIAYDAYSPLFRESDIGEVIPRYQWIIGETLNGVFLYVKPKEIESGN